MLFNRHVNFIFLSELVCFIVSITLNTKTLAFVATLKFAFKQSLCMYVCMYEMVIKLRYVFFLMTSGRLVT